MRDILNVGNAGVAEAVRAEADPGDLGVTEPERPRDGHPPEGYEP